MPGQAGLSLTVGILILLGGAATTGLLAGVGWREVLVAVLIIVIIRPLSGWLALARGKTDARLALHVTRAVNAHCAAHGIGAGSECREQRQNKNSFAMCVFHTSSSASGAVGEARTLSDSLEESS